MRTRTAAACLASVEAERNPLRAAPQSLREPVARPPAQRMPLARRATEPGQPALPLSTCAYIVLIAFALAYVAEVILEAATR